MSNDILEGAVTLLDAAREFWNERCHFKKNKGTQV